jgi:hypothetical protein
VAHSSRAGTWGRRALPQILDGLEPPDGFGIPPKGKPEGEIWNPGPPRTKVPAGKLGLPVLPLGMGMTGPPPPPKPLPRRAMPPAVPKSVKEHLDIMVETSFLHFIVKGNRLYRKFDELIGSKFNGHMEICGKREGILFVRVDSPHVMERCRYQTKDYVELLNREMGEEILVDIVFRVLQKDEPFREMYESPKPGDGS